jgi:glucose-1-phosphate cytidylyltransferase
MKVVLFCGGLGTRMRDFSESIPKPMVTIGYRPILWHVMKYYASFGHRDFILCLGYKADVIKNYFRQYDETVSNDFVLTKGGSEVELLSRDINDWRITFVDTGVHSNIGQRLKSVEKYLEGEKEFMANYTDGLTDVDLDAEYRFFKEQDKVACFAAVKPTQTFHMVNTNGPLVTSIKHVVDSGVRINGGYFIFKKEIFEYMKNGEELVHEPFVRLIEKQQLAAYAYDGFWACMDTFKERQMLDDMFSRGDTPWEVWKRKGKAAPAAGR